MKPMSEVHRKPVHHETRLSGKLTPLGGGQEDMSDLGGTTSPKKAIGGELILEISLGPMGFFFCRSVATSR